MQFKGGSSNGKWEAEHPALESSALTPPDPNVVLGPGYVALQNRSGPSNRDRRAACLCQRMILGEYQHFLESLALASFP